MKKIRAIALIIAVSLFFLLSCTSSISREELHSLRANLDSAESRVAELSEVLASLEEEHKLLQTDYESLEAKYQRLVDRLGESTLENPTWLELREFIEQDDTDRLHYSKGDFDCDGFAITLRDQASAYGFRCAYVSVSFGEGVVGHSFNAFETTDKGVVYVDVIGSDAIAYVEVWQPYGLISLDAVKSEVIDCAGDPSKFYGSLTQRSYREIFGYDYYIDYTQRLEFLQDSVEAYNNEVAEYYNDSTELSHSQLKKWLQNIRALEEDLGSIIYEPMEVVRGIEIYWN